MSIFGVQPEITEEIAAETRGRRFWVALVVSCAAITVIACSAPSAGGSDEAIGRTDVRVPDNISELNENEVEQRLGRLLTNADGIASQVSQEIEPTATPAEPSIDEILDLLGSASADTDEIVISVSAETLSQLQRPVLRIRAEPAHGTVEISGPYRIVYTPNGTGDGPDSFEYELFDGDRFIFSQVIEVK